MNDNEIKTKELNDAIKEMWDSLTDEQKEKAKECKSMDELMLLAGRYGIELPDEVLVTAAGGNTNMFYKTVKCPYCACGVSAEVIGDGSGKCVATCLCGKKFSFLNGVYYDENGRMIEPSDVKKGLFC
ncbi:MAG: hypothetical protein K6E68_00165 [Lachnospiraceae bacterium]|nr:hypothetical protein [Lachnospiraceae bacterium]